MGIEWEPPKWRREGRTGPGPAAPRYAKAKDRNTIRKGKDVGNPYSPHGPYSTGGFKGKAKAGKSSWNQNAGKGGSGNKGGDKGCCPMVAAVRSVKRGQFRLARRYAAMSVRLIAGRLA